MRVVKGESTSRVAHMKSAKGNISIMEACPEGTFVIIGNTHRKKNENISGWKLKRKIDNKQEVVYTFPEDYSLKGGQIVKVILKLYSKVYDKIKIVTKGHVDENQNDVLVYDGNSFGNGNSVSTYLYNADGQVLDFQS